MKLEEAIQKINQLSRFTFNHEQKALAIRMLKKAPQPEIKVWYDFIIQRVKLGFTFDTTTVPNYGQIALVQEQPKLNLINEKLSDKVEHKLIIGENYDVLKNLLLTHRNQIDIIYIDPPYNTKAAHSEGNTRTTQQGGYQSHSELTKKITKITEKVVNGKGKLNYRDKFARTGWLNMMKERLELAGDLLADNGVIFISIDDHEQDYLKVLMDEIFGEDNFVCNFVWQKTHLRKNNSLLVSNNHEYILCYRKNNDLKEFNRLPRTPENDKFYNCNDYDGRGPYQASNLTIKNGKKYDIFLVQEVGLVVDLKNKSGKKYEILKTYKPPKHLGWRFNKEKMQKLIQDNRIRKYERSLRLKRYLKEVGEVVTNTILDYKLVGHTEENQRLLNQIFSDYQEQIFDYPKGTRLIKYLIKLFPNGEKATILDFFAGSGTTGHAVLELNREDQGGRQFILVTNNENNIAKNVTYERLHRIIKGQTTEGKTNFEWLKANPPPPPKHNRLKIII